MANGRERRLKVTFFVGSVVGYVDNPTAIYSRGLAHGLSLRGNEVRIVEERQNEAFARTLREVGAGATLAFHDHFRTVQHHTYEARRGAQLLEWVTREIALIDTAIAVDGLEPELCRWLANLTREGLTRVYLTFDPASLTDETVSALELEKFDQILAPDQPAASIAWQPIRYAVAGQDLALAGSTADDADPILAAEVFEAAVNALAR
jgi:hypothetical protein